MKLTTVLNLSLRCVIELTNFDSGDPITHRIELYKCDHIDCYDVVVDGGLQQKRIEWRRILALIRKALPRQSRELNEFTLRQG
ncbi:hypothetical protein OAG1_17610 [Agarivorans sp. OAG1]|nr:hypothetical protein OAG1_17610 [Agarivorans sp. OAG1]